MTPKAINLCVIGLLFLSARPATSQTADSLRGAAGTPPVAAGVFPVAAESLPPAGDTLPVAADTLRLADVVLLARRANPMLRAARLRADAASERIAPAGALPDPQVTLGFLNRPVSDLTRTDQSMTKNAVGLSQRLPWPGQLGFARERERHLARAEAFEADESESTLVARVKSIYYQTAYLDRAVTIMRRTRDILRRLQDVSAAQYSVGAGLQQDVLQAQVAVARTDADITVLQQNRVAMAARLNSLLGRPATAAVGALELPEPEALPAEVDSLMRVAAANRPALAAARERIRAAEAGYRAAVRALFPNFTFRFEYGQRPEFDDLASFSVGISVPLWAGSKQLPQRREMRAISEMQSARELDLYNDTFARLSELRAVAVRARALSELYRTAIIPQAIASVESALSAYRVGKVDYLTLVQNQETANRFETESVRLAAEFQGAIAGIEALTNPMVR